jgi:hypothetical protein
MEPSNWYKSMYVLSSKYSSMNDTSGSDKLEFTRKSLSMLKRALGGAMLLKTQIDYQPFCEGVKSSLMKAQQTLKEKEWDDPKNNKIRATLKSSLIKETKALKRQVMSKLLNTMTHKSGENQMAIDSMTIAIINLEVLLLASTTHYVDLSKERLETLICSNHIINPILSEFHTELKSHLSKIPKCVIDSELQSVLSVFNTNYNINVSYEKWAPQFSKYWWRALGHLHEITNPIPRSSIEGINCTPAPHHDPIIQSMMHDVGIE